jgi:hypothetical protein
MACTESDLSVYAIEAFRRLEKLWKGPGDPDFSNFWKLGHSFDTIIDFFLLGPGFAKYATGFKEPALMGYDRSLPSGCWYDDFGWWGIAALKASEHSELFGTATPTFATIANRCWEMMNRNAPYVWDNNKNNPLFADLGPRFTGGVWNCDWTRADGCNRAKQCPQIPPDCDIPPGYNDTGGYLQGIQNTVTNGLYMVLAARLRNLGAAVLEYQFLNNWFNVSDPTDSLLTSVAGGVLVRERVGTYALKPGQGYTTVCGYDPTSCWAGDQGIIMGALIGLSLADQDSSGPSDPSDVPDADRLLQIAQGIAAGVRANSPNNILQAWVVGPGNSDYGDYDTGIGVYMRYLLYAYQSSPLMQAYFKSQGYMNFVCANAEDVMQKLDQPKTRSLVDLTNYLATLTVALAMTRS